MKKTTTTKKSNGKNSASKENNQDSQHMLQELFVDELKDIYWAEKHLTKALPKMQKAASSEELANAFADHLEVTEEHVARLEKIFGLLGEKAQAKKCDAMEGLVKEGESIIEDTEEGTEVRDIGLISAAQKVEHYEIATYGTLSHLANTLGHKDVAGLLHQTLEEEKETDATLTEIAENTIEPQIKGSEGGEDVEERSVR